jgi:ATP synthase F1 delta subunit
MTAARRYATALFQLGAEAGQTAAIEESLAALQPALAEVHSALANPVLSRAQRAQLATTLAKAVKAPKVLANTLQTLAANNRLALLPEVATIYQTLTDSAAGIARVRVQSVQKLTDAQRTQLKALVKNHLKAKNVELEESTEPRLLGGFRAFFGGQVWDASLTGNLSRLATKLKQSLNQR